MQCFKHKFFDAIILFFSADICLGLSLPESEENLECPPNNLSRLREFQRQIRELTASHNWNTASHNNYDAELLDLKQKILAIREKLDGTCRPATSENR